MPREKEDLIKIINREYKRFQKELAALQREQRELLIKYRKKLDELKLEELRKKYMLR
ncbi:MAG: hypothetical protein AAB731_03930 [Patescibacteria group bacterium]